MPQKSVILKSTFERNPNYNRKNPAKNKKQFRWNKDGRGKIVKVFGWLAMVSRCDDAVLACDRSELTVQARYAWEQLKTYLPQFLPYFEEVMGEPLEEARFMDRMHKMYYSYNKKNKGHKSDNCYSKEHPIQNKALNKYINPVHKIYSEGRKFTDADIEQILANVDE